MSEEMKLLRALCDALGFEVYMDVDYMPMKIGKEAFRMQVDLSRTQNRRIKHTKGLWDIDEDGMYTSELIEPIINYRVEKKES